MPRRALADHRPYLLLSLLFGISYFFVKDDPIGGTWLILWKGTGVAFLSIYAAHRGRGRDGALIAAVMAFGALGDMVLEISFLIGGVLFAIGHLIAIALYMLNRREQPVASQKLAGVALILTPPMLAGLLAFPLPNWQIAVAYALVVGAMAGAAWTSRYSRYRVGIGAVMFVVSDLLIVAGESGHVPREVGSWLIWPLYYGGQFLIATGVIQTIRRGQV